MNKEKRYPRERFTWSLQRICQHLAEGPLICSVQTRSFIDRSIKIKDVQVKALWVAGSYARGAIECGDLDLILDAESLTGGLPYARQIARSFFGATPNVSFYTGTPEKNTSGIEFPEARLVWSVEQPNWQDMLQAISVSEDVGRFERPSDRLPLTTKQFYFDNEEVDKLLALYDAEIIQWHFIPITSDRKTKPELSLDIEKQLKYKGLGKQTDIVLHHFFTLTPKYWENQRLYGNVREGFYIAGVHLSVGIPKLPYEFLESINIYQEILLPHLSVHGPNGAWVIERGCKHPLVIQSNQYYAFVLMSENSLSTICDFDKHGDKKELLELYTSLEVAQESVNHWKETSNNEVHFEVSKISGIELLNAIAKVECVEICERDGIIRIDLKGFRHYDTNIQELHDKIFSVLPTRKL